MKQLAALVGLAAGVVAASAAAASPTGADGEAARRAAVVARVGALTLTAGELEDRMAAMPRFQLAELGKTPLEVKKRFLEAFLIPELLLDAAASDPAAVARPASKDALRRAQANAAVRVARRQAAAPDKITDEAVRQYYESHKDQYDAAERIQLWRIVVATREEAEQVLAAVKAQPTPARFGELAREKSLDKATNLRSGNVGFVAEDGTSNEAGLRVEPAIFLAAKAVKDGELVPAPVAEGKSFSVVWRRGTLKAVKQSLADATPAIRANLARRAADEAVQKLVADLKKARGATVDAELVRTTELPTFLEGTRLGK